MLFDTEKPIAGRRRFLHRIPARAHEPRSSILATGRMGVHGMREVLVCLLLTAAAGSIHAQTSNTVGPGSGVPWNEPVLATDGSGGDGATPYDDYSKRMKSAEQINPLADNMFGDTYSPYLGTVEFENVDIDVPGNSALPVQLRRRFVVQSLPMGGGYDPSTGAPGNYYGGMGNWEIEVPYISGVFSSQYGWANPTAKSGGTSVRCSSAVYPTVPAPFSVNDVLISPKIHVPGIGDKDLVRDVDNVMPTSSTGNSSWTTKDFDAISCTPTDNGSGEGFVLTTKDGVSYTFNHYVTRGYPALAIGKNPDTGQPNKLGRTMVFLLATQVKDSHGNTVTYEYNTAPGLPSAIYSSDQRRIDFTYNQTAPWRLVSAQVSAHQSSGDTPRVWQYGYTTTSNGNFDELTTVTLPDLSAWGYQYSNSGSDPGSSFPDGLARNYDYLYIQNVINDASPCDPPPPVGGAFKLQITHPSGSAGTFVFDHLRHDRTVGATGSCVYDTSSGMYHLARMGFADAFSLTYKTIKDTASSASTWSYDYDVSPTCGAKTNRVSLPDSAGKIESTFSDYWGATSSIGRSNSCSTTLHAIEGSLLGTTTYSGSGAVLRSTSNMYVMAKDNDVWSYAFPVRVGGEFVPLDDDSTLSLRPLLSTSTSQQATTFTRSNLASSFDAYARPTQYTVSSSPDCGSCSRDEKVVFKDDMTKWVLGLLDTKQVKGAGQPTWITALDNDYDPSTLDLTKVTEFDVVKRTMTYYTDGTLHTVNDGLHTTTLGAFKRGIPQSVSYADGSSQSATVDDVGEITSITDERSNTTSYHYNPVGRLDTITHPADVVSWYPTSILYEQVATTEAGIAGSHWRATRTTGNAKQITYYDQRLRPIVTQEYDAGDVSNTTRYTRRGFDFANRSTFVSYPATSVSPTAGTHTTYDALGRTLTTSADSELGSLTTTTAYSNASFQTTTTDPRSVQTTTTYQAFDEPGYDAPLVTTAAVGQPEQQVATIDRDIFGKPKSITRSGTYGGSPQSLTRSYVYDSGQRLCKTVDPETQATIQAYDAAGNVSWSLKGSTLTSLSSCNNTTPLSGATSYTYDGRNRLKNTDYPSGTSDIANTYYPDGSLNTTTTNGATWTYTYNKLHLPMSESLSYDGQTYALAWEYDRNASIKTLTYPDLTPIDYAPNALGQPGQAGTYASGVKYYPNGAMSGFTYGNGIVHTLTQNARKLPLRSWDAKPATGAVTDLTYAYDANANVTAITDGTVGNSETRSPIQYDKLNRLTGVTATSALVTASYAYDALDNLRTSTVGTRTCTSTIDGVNRLTALSGSNCAIGSYAYDTQGHGNVVQRGTQAFTWDGADRLTGATGKETYAYDGLGHRVGLKRAADNSTLYQVYSKAGELLFAFDTQTGITSNYVMLNGSLVARLDGTLGGNVPAVPSAPTLPSPQISTTGAYTVSWTAVSGATGYVLLRSANGGSASPVTGSQITTMSWSESGRISGAYTYTLEACNSSGCSAPSTGATEKVLLAPTSISSTSMSVPENTAYTVSWGSVITATSYQLDENSGSGWSPSTVTTTSKTFTKPAGSYQYRVHACIGTTCSGASTTITVAVNQASPPPIPQNVRVSTANSTDGNFTVEWDPSTGASTYKVREYYNLNTITDLPSVTTTSWSPSPAKTVSGSYRYTVFACNSSNACSNESVGAIVTVSLPVSLGVPTGLQACTGPGNTNCTTPGNGALEVLKNKTYTVSWNAVDNATSYNVKEVKTPSCGSTQITTSSVTTTSKAFGAAIVTCSGTEMSVNYDYTVQACAGTNCGGWTAASVTVESVPVLARSPELTGTTSVTYLHTDALHSSVVETDSTGAAKSNSRPKYEAYGNPTTGYVQGPGYTGHVMDASTQLVYMQQRYMDPMSGRFLSTDPVTASFNRYAYANNNPYKNIDPDGRMSGDVSSIKRRTFDTDDVKTYQVGPEGGGRDEASEIAAEVHRDFIGKQNDGGQKVAAGASEIADVVDEQATDTVKYWWLGGVVGKALKLVGVGVKSAGVGSLVFRTTKDAATAADAMGFKRISETVHGQAIFQRGRQFISRDVDGHNGGAWKVANSIEALGSKETRTGTFNADLSQRVGD